MAGSSLWMLIDDIASVLDDVGLMTKVAAKKTAGVLGDDLALNAEQVAGVRAEREWPVVWAVAKGSLVNKAILVPTALALSVFAPGLVLPLLMVGGAYLCFEGFEKVVHAFHRRRHPASVPTEIQEETDLADLERKKIRGAIRTDFILSAEIIVIALGTVKDAPLTVRVLALIGVALLMTVGVYGFVAALVKLDDLGLALVRGRARWKAAVGRFLLVLAPRLMRFLSFAGTLAMFLVGGGILLHGLAPSLGHLSVPLLPTVLNLLAGVMAGALVFLVVAGVRGVMRLTTR
ncbi:MAG: DUF808 domain-containing protein [Firmicutes bacterium]|nr:DUF808 domain-containing protein [Bacillota bacterium]